MEVMVRLGRALINGGIVAECWVVLIADKTFHCWLADNAVMGRHEESRQVGNCNLRSDINVFNGLCPV